jgi:Xaa-Pro aminopeptidase
MLFNRARASAIMREHGLSGLLASSPEHIVYATGYEDWRLATSSERHTYAVIPPAGEPALVAPLVAADYLGRAASVVSRVYTFGTFNMVCAPDARLSGVEERVAAIVAANRHNDARTALRDVVADLSMTGLIGIDEHGWSPWHRRWLEETLRGNDIVEADEVFKRIRLVKTEPEIERLRLAVRAAEHGMLAAFAAAGRGSTDNDLERRFRAAMLSLGAMPGHFESSAGIRGGLDAAGRVLEYRLCRGDVIHIDCGGRYRTYCADTGRTAALGRASGMLLRYYDALRAGLEEVLIGLRPGAVGGDLFTCGMERVRSLGIPRYERRQIGHGIGLDYYEGPFLRPPGEAGLPGSAGADVVLEQGMVVNVEMPYYELGVGGLQIEETLLITAGGYESLTSAERGILSAGAGPP